MTSGALETAITPTRARILDAALERIGEVGLAKLSLEDVANGAGTSRQTVYRHFGNRDALLAAVVLREESQLMERIHQAATQHADLGDAIRAATLSALQVVRDHPLLDRLVATEPEAIIPLLTTDAAPVLGAAREVLEGVLADRVPGADVQRRRAVADLATRLLISYTVNPPDADPEAVADLLALLCTRALEA